MTGKTKAGLGVFVAAAALLPVSCGAPKSPWDGVGGPPRVVATFPPLACFVQNVGGNDVGVLTLCTTTGPHEFEPTVEDKQKLEAADLFVINGLGLEDQFAVGMIESSKNSRLRDKGAPGKIDLGARLLKAGLVDKFEAHDEHDHDKHKDAHGHDEHQHGEYDPHAWLGIPQAVRMVEIIRDELKSADPAHAEGYDRRAAEYVARLRKLHDEGKAALAGKKNRKIVTSHDSLHYFAKSFDIEVEGVVQLQPGTELDPRTLEDLVKTCKDEGVRVIATEPQYRQQGTAETLVKELRARGVADVTIIDLDPLENLVGDSKLDAGWYERRMRANLDELKKALR